MPDQDLIANREEMIAVGKQLVESGLVIATWGNISCRTSGTGSGARETDSCLITPSGMAYETLEPEDLVMIDGGGQVLAGERKPSSERLLHTAIYRSRRDVQAIVHTHSAAACSFAVAQEEIPVILEEMAQLIGGPVQVAAYAPPGTTMLAENALAALGERNAVLMANHGVVAVGRSMAEALTIAMLVEKAAQVMLGAIALGRPHVISPQDTKLLRKSFLKSYGQKNDASSNS